MRYILLTIFCGMMTVIMVEAAVRIFGKDPFESKINSIAMFLLAAVLFLLAVGGFR